jgi:protocatechuate 3,4-dioxygenase beta subunit
MKSNNQNVLVVLLFCILIAANFYLNGKDQIAKISDIRGDILICKFELLLDMAVDQRNEIKKQMNSNKSRVQQIALEKELISMDGKIFELEEKIIELKLKNTALKVSASKPAADDDDGFEDNDDMAHAAQISAGKYTNLKLYDDDWYKVYVSGGKDMKVSIQGTFGGAHLGDIDVEIYDGSGDFIVAGISGRDSETIFATDLSAGWYYIKLGYFWNNGQLQNIYSLQVQIGTNLGEGTATGRVTDTNGAGIGNLWVYIQKTYEDPGPSNWMGSHEAYTLTDSNGNYKISLPPKNYKFLFYARATGLNYVNEYYNNKFSYDDADLVPFISGQTTSGINAQLDAGGLIRGRVIDENSSPLENAYARPYTSDGTRLTSGRTDQDGYYNVFSSPGNVKVLFYTPGEAQFQDNHIYRWYNNKQFFNQADFVAVQANQTTQNINAQLFPGCGYISGTVTNTAGEGIENAVVFLYETSQFVLLTTRTTDENGDYTFTHLPTGNFKIFFDAESMGYISEWYNNKTTFSGATLIPVTAGQTTTGINAQLSSETSNEPPSITITEPSNGASVSGQIDINTVYSDDYYQFSRFELWWDNELIVGLDGDDIPRGGYETVLDTTAYSNGNHTVKAYITDTVNQTAQHQITVNVNNPNDYDPTVSIINPSNGTTVSGTVSIQAEAADDKGLNKVEFYIDNTKIGEDTGSPYEYAWNTTLYSNGSHTIKAIAYDTINQDTQHQISVIVNNVAGDNPPFVTITNPGEGSESRGTVNIQANASDDYGVTKVEFYLDNVLLAADTSAPFLYSWDSTGSFNGNYKIKAIAYDTQNQTAEDEVSIYLNNQVDEPPVVRILTLKGAVVSGIVNIHTYAVDDNSVSKTRFYIDGVQIEEKSVGDCLFTWDTTQYDNTAHTIKAEAYDSVNQRSFKQKTVIVHNISGDQVPQFTQTTIASLPGGETANVTAVTTVSGSVNIQVTVSDDNGIDKVVFYIDGVKKHTDTSPPYQYTWNTTQYSNGHHTIDIFVYDTAGQTVMKQETVKVDNGGDTAPIVSIVSLEDEATISGDVMIAALAEDDTGISKVEFYINNSLKISDTSPPYQYITDTTGLTNGRHSIKVKAYDTASHTSEHQIYVTVNNAAIEGVDVSITYPANGAQVAGVVPIQVEAASDAGIKTVEFYIDGTIMNEDTTYPYQYHWDTSTYSLGTHSIQVIAYDTENESAESHINVEVAAYEAAGILLNRTQLTFGCIKGGNSPASQSILVSNTGTAALNWTAAADKPWINLSPTAGIGDGIITVSIDPTGLAQGTYNGILTVSDPNASNSPQAASVTLNIYKSGESSVPFGNYSTPIDGSTVSSSVPFTGWVLDDIGVESVKIYRDPVTGEGSNMVYIGNAVFVEGARPDVEAAFPDYPMNYRAGWGYMMLTNFLPNGGNGTFRIYAIATDVEGHSVTLGVKTVLVDNENAVKPFGAIDTPQQGGIAAGSSFRNHGWVLTPMPNTVPTDGSTIYVLVDGVSLGHPIYNIYRSDVAALFPGYSNSDGAGAYFDIDTTAYDNGVHTIAWLAADNAGNSDGIGSRYFTIQNTTSGNSSSQAQEFFSSSQLDRIPVNDIELVKVNRGDDNTSQSQWIGPDEKGIITIKLKELERLVILLSSEASDMTGYMIVGDQLRPLPIGSTIDKNGTFFWQPVPSFVGVYRMVFVIKDPHGKLSRKDIVFNIEPKFRK